MDDIEFLNKKEIQDSFEKAIKSRKSNQNYLILQVLAGSGLRVSELVNLAPQNINSDKKIFRVKGKGGKIRNIDVNSNLLQLLELYIDNKDIKKTKPIFPISDRQVRNITEKFAEYHPHAFRHSYAIQLLRKTGNIRYVQAQLGHDSLATTQIYLKYMSFEQEKEKIETLWS